MITVVNTPMVTSHNRLPLILRSLQYESLYTLSVVRVPGSAYGTPKMFVGPKSTSGGGAQIYTNSNGKGKATYAGCNFGLSDGGSGGWQIDSV